MKSFFGQAPLEEMNALFSDKMIFEGPFHKSTTAREYIDTLKDNPPKDASYILEKTYQDEHSACLIYVTCKIAILPIIWAAPKILKVIRIVQ